MQRIKFALNISPEKYIKYYQGVASEVVVVAEDGRTLRFPASALQKFISHDGIEGRFEIVFDANNKMLEINRAE